MAVFSTGANRALPQRGPAPGFRFFCYALLALALMYLDQRGGWLERVRYGLQAAAYPLQLAVNSPSAAWRWTTDTLETRASIEARNVALKNENRALKLRMLRFEALEQENIRLRNLRAALPPLAARWLFGEIISAENTTLRHRVVVNRGKASGVFKGQTVVVDGGLLGQTLRVGPWSTEVILLTDPEHAVPVQIVRNGLRTIAVGAGDTSTMTLPYLPIQSDIREGDMLVTSGLGGVFPAGYPVARIVAVRRDGSSPLAQVRATPLAGIERERQVMFLWFNPGNSAAPTTSPDAEPQGGTPRPVTVPRTPATGASPAATAAALPVGVDANQAAAAIPAGGTAPVTAPKQAAAPAAPQTAPKPATPTSAPASPSR